MKWNQLFGADKVPSFEDIYAYIGEAKPVWDELLLYLEAMPKVKWQMDYSKCAAQPGWNLKYKKSGKSLCTLYPMPNHFIALVVVGRKEENEVAFAMEAGVFSAYVTELYQKTAFSAMGRWLMIEVKDRQVLENVRNLIEIRLRSK